jgi:phosphohistidine phosphatase
MKYFAEETGFPLEDVVTDETIYFGNSLQLTRKIQKLDDSFNCVMIVGHNPDITVLASRLTGKNIDNVPTCGLVCMDFNVKSWNDVDDNTGSLRFFDYPKKHD